MSMVIAHNIASMNAQKNLYSTNRALDSSLSKLSSGLRINTGQDGPADLVISEQLRSQSNGLERAVRNTTEAVNVLSIAEGALNEMSSILKKMRALAIHSASDGVTSPDQVAADQAEMDSGIQTLERIAATTKYSDQFLLNGSKDITYSVDTTVRGTQNNRLVNAGLSTFSQIFKRDGYQVNISFNGAVNANAATALGNASMTRQAAKAYLEVDPFEGSPSQVTENGLLTQGQSFILTGALGSRQFRFSEGAHISELVNAINNVAGSTGIEAALTFHSGQWVNLATAWNHIDSVGCCAIDVGGFAPNEHTVMTVYDNYKTNANGQKVVIACMVELFSEVDVIFGKNTDGQGNVFVKVLDDRGNYELYKDESLSKESLIGYGNASDYDTIVNQSDLPVGELNNSGMKMIVRLGADAAAGDVVRVSLGNVRLDDGAVTTTGEGAEHMNMDHSTASGVQLGTNTSKDGKIFLKTVWGEGNTATVYAYNNALMREQDLVAKTADTVTIGENCAVILDSIWNDEHTASTGLGLTLCFNRASGKENAVETTELQFINLGMRIYSSEYGSDQFIKLQQFEGGLFVDYEDQANYDSVRLIEKGATYQKNGQDATVLVNGQQMKTSGLRLNLATQDIMADITFNAGKVGSTTIAQVGYGDGSVFTKNTSLTFAFDLSEYETTAWKHGDFYLPTDVPRVDQGSNWASNMHLSALLNNANHNTFETVGNFQGGMRLQLGEGSGDQERTVIGIKGMSTAQLGRLEVTGQFDKSKAVIETRTVSIQDVMGGGVSSLSADPTLAMKIVDKAIRDVSELRAQIGAMQANMLQTNENNLRETIENITKTESAIRDTDMASEMTEFTKNQILSNAGVSMLGQANIQQQNVMALLQ